MLYRIAFSLFVWYCSGVIEVVAKAAVTAVGNCEFGVPVMVALLVVGERLMVDEVEEVEVATKLDRMLVELEPVELLDKAELDELVDVAEVRNAVRDTEPDELSDELDADDVLVRAEVLAELLPELAVKMLDEMTEPNNLELVELLIAAEMLPVLVDWLVKLVDDVLDEEGVCEVLLLIELVADNEVDVSEEVPAEELVDDVEPADCGMCVVPVKLGTYVTTVDELCAERVVDVELVDGDRTSLVVLVGDRVEEVVVCVLLTAA